MNKKLRFIIILFFFFKQINFFFANELLNDEVIQKIIFEKIKQSESNWKYYLINDLELLKKDGQSIFYLGIQFENLEAVNIGKRSLGSYLIRRTDPKYGIELLFQALKYFRSIKSHRIHIEILNEIGNGYFLKGDLQSAEQYFLESIQVGKAAKIIPFAYLAEINLARVYMTLGQFHKSKALINHYKKMCLHYKKNEAVSNAYALLGNLAQNQNNNELAKEYYKKSVYFGLKSNSKSQIAHAYNNIAMIHFTDGNTQKSIEYFLKAFDLRKQTGNLINLGESYYNISSYYLELGKYQQAKDWASRFEQFGHKNRLKDFILEAVFLKYEIAKLQNLTVSALEYLEAYTKLNQQNQVLPVEKTIYNDLQNYKKAELKLQKRVRDRKSKNLLLQGENKNLYFVLFVIVLLIPIVFVFFIKSKNQTVEDNMEV